MPENQTCQKGPLKPKLWTFAFFTFIFINIFIFLGFDTLLPTLTLYLSSHGASESSIGRIFSCFFVAAIPIRMMSPRLAARFGPLILIRMGLLTCSLAVIGYFWATSNHLAMLARFFHGLGFGLASTLIAAMASQIIPISRMGEGMGYLGLGAIVSLASGPFLGLFLQKQFGYLTLFLGAGCIYLAGAIWSLTLPKPMALKKPAKTIRPILFSRMVLGPSLLMYMTGIAISSAVIYMALFCQEHGFPIEVAGHFFVFSTFGVLAARLFSGRIHDTFGHRFVIIPAIILLGIATLIIARLENPQALYAASICWGLATGSLFPSIQALAFAVAPLERRTEAAASLFNAFDLGFGTGSIILGQLASWAGSYQAVYWGSFLNALLFLLAYFSTSFREKNNNPTQTP